MHDPALKTRARELRKQGLLIRVIAVELDVPKATVIRWLNPELEKRERAKARKRKYGDGSKCPKCKRRKTANATLCYRCERKARRYWTRERVIEAIQQWALDKGHAPVSTEWQSSGKNHPAISSIVQEGPNPVFRSWSEALIAAGFTPRLHRSGQRKFRPGEKAALRRRIREQKIIKAMEKENKDGNATGVRANEDVPDEAGGA